MLVLVFVSNMSQSRVKNGPKTNAQIHLIYWKPPNSCLKTSFFMLEISHPPNDWMLLKCTSDLKANHSVPSSTSLQDHQTLLFHQAREFFFFSEKKQNKKQRWSTDWTKWTKTVFIRWNRHLVIAKFSEFDMFNTLNDITVGFSQMAFIFLVPWGHCTTGKSRQSQKSVLMWVWYLFWWFSSHFRLHKVSSDTPSRLNLTCGLYLTQPFVPLGSGALIFSFLSLIWWFRSMIGWHAQK